MILYISVRTHGIRIIVYCPRKSVCVTAEEIKEFIDDLYIIYAG